MSAEGGTAARPRQARRRLAVLLWVGVAIVTWNGLYDLRISLGIRDYLVHAALHAAGRGPELPMAEMMRHTVSAAVKVATFWTALVLAAGLGTVRLLDSGTGAAEAPAARRS